MRSRYVAADYELLPSIEAVLIHEPVRFPASYKLSFRLATTCASPKLEAHLKSTRCKEAV
jgi:hypothetical protein